MFPCGVLWILIFIESVRLCSSFNNEWNKLVLLALKHSGFKNYLLSSSDETILMRINLSVAGGKKYKYPVSIEMFCKNVYICVLFN